MNNQTRIFLREIQGKLKSPITGNKEFASESAVVDYAVKTLYETLKKHKQL
jgi:hypothetical protein